VIVVSGEKIHSVKRTLGEGIKSNIPEWRVKNGVGPSDEKVV